MSRTEGDPDVVVALLDGPVASGHPLLSAAHIRATAADGAQSCRATGSPACAHGTFIAGILVASRDSRSRGSAPGCTLLSRPVFPERGSDEHPSASADDLADAIVDSVRSGARILNMSLATTLSSSAQHGLVHALSYAGRRGTLVVAAAGNQSIVGGSVITRHPAVIPVVAIDRRGRPLGRSNLGASIGRRGISAPG